MTRASRRVIGILAATAWLAGCVPGPQTNAPTEGATVERGLLLLSQRRYPEARTNFNKLGPFKTRDARALMGLAIAADMTGDFRTADRAYEQLLVLTPDQPMLYNNMGYSYMLRGDLDRALSYLTEAARRDPENPAIRNNLAMLRGVVPLR